MELKADDNDKIMLKSIKEPNMKIITKDEISIMDEVINEYKDKTSKELSDISHEYIGWKNTKDGELIDFKYSDNFKLK